MIREHFTPKERLAGLTAEQILAALPPEQIHQYLDRLAADSPPTPARKPRRKK